MERWNNLEGADAGRVEWVQGFHPNVNWDVEQRKDRVLKIMLEIN